MSSSTNSSSTHLSALEREIHDFIAGELVSAGGGPPIGPEDDLIKRGILDSLGVTQVVDFCESRYGITVTDADLVPENFQTVRRLAEFVDGKRAEPRSAAAGR
jgi:acyl carrier protein